MKNSYFSLLQKIVPKPDVVFHTGDEESWKRFELEIGIVLPDDYKELINTYGTGGIGNFIWFLTPFVNDDNVNYLKKMSVMIEAYKTSKDSFQEYYKYDVFPAENGLLPWGYTDNGDELYWKTDAEVDNWEIVVYESASPDCYNYKMSVSEFLYKIIIRELRVDFFSDELFDEEIKYVSVNAN